MKKIKYFFKRKFWQIRNVFRWLPIIWNQYDFDYNYAIKVFKFQLNKIADFMDSENAWGARSKQDAIRIRNIIKLMDKVYSEEYSMEYQDILKEMYGEDVLEVSFIETDNTTFNDFSGKTEKLYTMRYKYESWDNAEEIEIIKNELFLMSQEKQRRAHKLLWELIEHNIQGWWD